MHADMPILIRGVLLADLGFLTLILGLRAQTPTRFSRTFTLLAVYVTLEMVGHGVAERGVAILLSLLLP